MSMPASEQADEALGRLGDAIAGLTGISAAFVKWDEMSPEVRRDLGFAIQTVAETLQESHDELSRYVCKVCQRERVVERGRR